MLVGRCRAAKEVREKAGPHAIKKQQGEVVPEAQVAHGDELERSFRGIQHLSGVIQLLEHALDVTAGSGTRAGSLSRRSDGH